jgi:hypothetical protein
MMEKAEVILETSDFYLLSDYRLKAARRMNTWRKARCSARLCSPREQKDWLVLDARRSSGDVKD